jgi:hypothetical protein
MVLGEVRCPPRRSRTRLTTSWLVVSRLGKRASLRSAPASWLLRADRSDAVPSAGVLEWVGE